MGVANEIGALLQNQQAQRRHVLDAIRLANDRQQVIQVSLVLSDGAADQGVGLAALHHHGANRRGVGPHHFARQNRRHADARRRRVIFPRIFRISRIVLGIDKFDVLANRQA